MFNRMLPITLIVPILFLTAFPISDLAGGGDCYDWKPIECNGPAQTGCPIRYSADGYSFGYDKILRPNNDASNCNTSLDSIGATCTNYLLYENVTGACGWH